MVDIKLYVPTTRFPAACDEEGREVRVVEFCPAPQTAHLAVDDSWESLIPGQFRAAVHRLCQNANLPLPDKADDIILPQPLMFDDAERRNILLGSLLAAHAVKGACQEVPSRLYVGAGYDSEANLVAPPNERRLLQAAYQHMAAQSDNFRESFTQIILRPGIVKSDGAGPILRQIQNLGVTIVTPANLAEAVAHSRYHRTPAQSLAMYNQLRPGCS